MATLNLVSLIMDRTEVVDRNDRTSVYQFKPNTLVQGRAILSASSAETFDRFVVYLGWKSYDLKKYSLDESGYTDSNWPNFDSFGKVSLSPISPLAFDFAVKVPSGPLTYSGQLFAINWYLRFSGEFSGLRGILSNWNRPIVEQLVIVR